MSFKLAFGLPALAIVLRVRAQRQDRWPASPAPALVLGLGASCSAFGEPLWASVVAGQAQTGRATLEYVAGLWAQAGWNVAGPLVLLAALALAAAAPRSPTPSSRAAWLAASLGVAAAARHAAQARQLR